MMEATSIFALHNQFLVWVAGKILLHCDLDLVLTEYYKERLDSRLKNKETHMNKNNSTESNVFSLPTHLPVPIDWISSLKPSSTRLPFSFLTPSLSPLSRSSLSNKSIPSASCHNNITCHLLQPYVTQLNLSTSDLPSFSFIFISFQGVYLEVKAADTPNSENISTGPQFQAFYITSIPYRGEPGSLFFEGANISKVLEKFENMCDDYQMSTFEKICRLPWYCRIFTARNVRSVIIFSGLDWIKICASLKKKYKDRDIAKQISSFAYLESFKDKLRTENAEILQFCRDYSEISKELLSKGKLDKYTQLRWFLQGLRSSIKSKLINQYDIDLGRDAVPDFGEILKKAYSLIETRKKMVELGTTDTKNGRISDLVDRYSKNDELDNPLSGPSKLSDFLFQASIVSTAPFILATPSQNDQKIDHFTDMMQSLTFSVRTLQGNADSSAIIFQPRAQTANTSSESRIRTDYRGDGANKTLPEGDTKCMYR